MTIRQLAACARSLALALAVTAPLAAQSPKGWMVRPDRSASALDPDAAGDIKFTTVGSGFHAVNPGAAVFWNPANTIAGKYVLKGNFTLNTPSNHTNYYGLVVGGSGLDSAGQSYVYFMVAQDGTWLIKQRDGDATKMVAPKTANDAVKRPDATGKSTNALEVRVMADKIDFAVNGTVVRSLPKAGLAATTDGAYGIRVNHRLDVTIDGFGATKQK